MTDFQPEIDLSSVQAALRKSIKPIAEVVAIDFVDLQFGLAFSLIDEQSVVDVTEVISLREDCYTGTIFDLACSSGDNPIKVRQLLSKLAPLSDLYTEGRSISLSKERWSFIIVWLALSAVTRETISPLEAITILRSLQYNITGLAPDWYEYAAGIREDNPEGMAYMLDSVSGFTQRARHVVKSQGSRFLFPGKTLPE